MSCVYTTIQILSLWMTIYDTIDFEIAKSRSPIEATNRITAPGVPSGMGGDSPGAPSRLRGAGVGSAIGGITIVVLSFLLPYAPAAIATVAVGGIGLFEAFGLGLEPLVLGTLAVGAGVIDVVVVGVLERFQSGL